MDPQLPEPDPGIAPGVDLDERLFVAKRVARDEPRVRPPSASSSSCVPRSTIRPWSRTTIWSASRTVERRCAIVIVVRPSASRSSASCTARSVLRVERARRLVEDEHGRVAKDGAGDRHPLLLAAREAVAALADERVVAVLEAGDQVVDVRRPRGVLDLLVGRVGPREAQVLADRAWKRYVSCETTPIVRGERVEGHVADVDPVDRDPPAVDVVEARDEVAERRLAGAGLADDRGARAGAARRRRRPAASTARRAS